MLDANIASIRTDYKKAVLDEAGIASNPFKQFDVWWAEVLQSEITEPNAFTLSSVDSSNHPHSRIVLLKSYDESGYVFFTNYSSAKAQEFVANPNVSLLFFWKELERQVRIEGIIQKVPEQVSREYFYSRPRESQIGAWTSLQSSEVDSRITLEEKYKNLTEQFKGSDVPFPDNWGGYIVAPHSFEFWQGRPSRLHDRIKYKKTDGNEWQIVRLQP